LDGSRRRRNCGAGHFDDQDSLRQGCGVALGDADIVNQIFRIENVATHPAERITANDEERQRQGFDLQTTFKWAVRDQVPDVRRGAASTDGGYGAPGRGGGGAGVALDGPGAQRAVREQGSMAAWLSSQIRHATLHL
jgi:hypothetical protein